MESKNTIPPFLEFLMRHRDDTGVMADLRCALIPAREYRAWPYIARFCNLENDRERIIAATVGAAFALQPECGGKLDNMGDVMGKVACGDNGIDGLSSYMSRFRRLLNCDNVEELSPQLHTIFKAAQARDIPINHENLWNDLFYWGERVKRRWAAHYWPHEERKMNSGDDGDE